MHALNIHAYEKLPLFHAGLIMGVALVILALLALRKPENVKGLLRHAHLATTAGQILFGIDMLWIALLLFDADWNCLRMELFMFEPLRNILLLLCPVIWLMMSSMSKQHLLPRALGLFLLLTAIVPMTAAFLKEPLTRILLPLWWYPVLTAGLFLVGKPYLFRDWVDKLLQYPRLYTAIAWFNLIYGFAILTCSFLFWL